MAARIRQTGPSPVLEPGTADIRLRWPAGARPWTAVRLRRRKRRSLAVVVAELVPGLPRGLLLRSTVAWTQLFGMVTFELFGQLVGTLDPADEFFTTAWNRGRTSWASDSPAKEMGQLSFATRSASCLDCATRWGTRSSRIDVTRRVPPTTLPSADQASAPSQSA